MTTETFPLPSTYTWGYVVGRIIYAIGDTSEDADDKPQARAAAGKVTFTPLVTGARVTGGADYTAIVMNGPVTATLSSTGRLLDGEGRQGIWLIEGTYRVRVTLTPTSDGLVGTLPEFEIAVTAAHTALAPLDLATAAPASLPTGAVVQTLVVPANGGVGQVLARGTGGTLSWIDPPSGGGGVSSWDDLEDKPAVIAAGPTVAAARASIGAGTSSLAIGTGAGDAKAGNWAPAVADVTGLTTALGAKANSADLTTLALAVAGKADAAALPTAASDTVAGLVERATDAEVTTGADTTRYVTPKQLKDNSPAPTLANLPAGSTITARWSGTAWPARPTARGDLTVMWLDLLGTAPTAMPAGYLGGVDVFYQRED